MQNTPILLVPGFFLFVLMKRHNKKLTNSDGIRFIVSVFLISLFLIALSYQFTELLKNSSFSDSLFFIPLEEIEHYEKIINVVAIDVYINSFFIAIVWWGLSKLDLISTINMFISKDVLRDFDRCMQDYGRDQDLKIFKNIKWVQFLIVILIGLIDMCLLNPIRSVLNLFSQILFLSDDSNHCKELEVLINELVLISLKSDKIYIGRIESADINILANSDDIIKFVPMYSGYRDEQKAVHLNTEYIFSDDNQKDGLAIIIFKREVVSISKFDIDLGKEFIKKEMLKVSDKLNKSSSST